MHVVLLCTAFIMAALIVIAAAAAGIGPMLQGVLYLAIFGATWGFGKLMFRL